MQQSLLSHPNVFVLRLEDVTEQLLQQQQQQRQQPTSTSASATNVSGFTHTHSVPMRMTLPAVVRVLKTATNSSVSHSPIFFTADPPPPADSSAPSAASEASANNIDNMGQPQPQPPHEFTSLPLPVEYTMPQQNQNQNVFPSGAGGGLQWARNTAAVVLSTKLPDASALGRLRLLQEVLSIVDPTAVDLDTPIVEREKGHPVTLTTCIRSASLLRLCLQF